MDINVVKTGSSGNFVVINGKIAIDIGVSYKTVKPYEKDLKIVLLTHIHSDHFRPSTVRSLHRNRPTLRFGCCEWMVDPLIRAGVDKRAIDVLDATVRMQGGMTYKDLAIICPEPLYHDVLNCGYHIFIGSESLFYATDTGSLDGVVAKNYTLYAIEANHREDEIKRKIEEKENNGEYAYERRSAEYHLSEEQLVEWLAENAGPESEYVLLHQHTERRTG